MNSIQELKQKKAEYIQQKADEIQASMVNSNHLTYKLSTCDYSGWDIELHRNFKDISHELEIRGFKVTYTVNHGVYDWVISL